MPGEALFQQGALAVRQGADERLARVKGGARSDSLDSGSISGRGPEGKKGGDGTTMAVCPKIL